MSPTLLTVLTLVAVVVITFVAIILSARKNMPAILSAQRAFFTETGYRHPDIPTAAIDEQVRYWPRGSVSTRKRQTRYVKPDPAGPILFDSLMTSDGRTRTKRECWRMTLVTQPGLRLQIAEKTLLPSLGKSMREHFGSSKRSWKQIYPGPIEISDPAIATRFAVFGEDAEAVRSVLARPELRDRLLRRAEVDLVVDNQSIVFSDPTGKNLAVGRKRLDVAPSLLASIPVHQDVHAILGAVRDAVNQR